MEYLSRTVEPEASVSGIYVGTVTMAPHVHSAEGEAVQVNTLEHVELHITLSTSDRGNVLVQLQCPSGTESALLSNRRDTSSNDLDWTMMTVRCWDEQPHGDYTLTVTSPAGDATVLHSWWLKLYGTCVGPGCGDGAIIQSWIIAQDGSVEAGGGTTASPAPKPEAGCGEYGCDGASSASNVVTTTSSSSATRSLAALLSSTLAAVSGALETPSPTPTEMLGGAGGGGGSTGGWWDEEATTPVAHTPSDGTSSGLTNTDDGSGSCHTNMHTPGLRMELLVSMVMIVFFT